ncbi:hypothetical protein Tco_1336682 [Tanacetum coccineum]
MLFRRLIIYTFMYPFASMADESQFREHYYVPGMSPEEEQAEILRLAAPIIALGVPESVFNRVNLMGEGFLFKYTMKLLKYVFSLNQRGILEEAINLGVTKNFFTQPIHCDTSGFGKLAHFLRSKEGQEILLGIQRKKKLEKKLMKLAACIVKPKDWLVVRKSDDIETTLPCAEIDCSDQRKKRRIDEVSKPASGSEERDVIE